MIENMNIMPFEYQEKPVRVVMQQNTPWWIAKDVCDVLDITNHRDAVSRLDEDEKDYVGITDAMDRLRENTLAISESGLYALIFQSRKPEAKTFRKWVTSEVLPAIRTSGSYHIQPAASPAPDAALAAAQQVIAAQQYALAAQKDLIALLHTDASRLRRQLSYVETDALVQFPFSDEERKQIRAWANAKQTVVQIARKLRCPANAVAYVLEEL